MNSLQRPVGLVDASSRIVHRTVHELRDLVEYKEACFEAPLLANNYIMFVSLRIIRYIIQSIVSFGDLLYVKDQNLNN